jgi:hypothetical protein
MAFMGVQLPMQIFMWVMQGSHVLSYSGKEDDVDFLLQKAESLARPRRYYLCRRLMTKAAVRLTGGGSKGFSSMVCGSSSPMQ